MVIASRSLGARVTWTGAFNFLANNDVTFTVRWGEVTRAIMVFQPIFLATIGESSSAKSKWGVLNLSNHKKTSAENLTSLKNIFDCKNNELHKKEVISYFHLNTVCRCRLRRLLKIAKFVLRSEGEKDPSFRSSNVIFRGVGEIRIFFLPKCSPTWRHFLNVCP